MFSYSYLYSDIKKAKKSEMHFHSLSINKGLRKGGIPGIRICFQRCQERKSFPSQWDVWIYPLASLIALKIFFFFSLILERNKSQDWDGNHDSKVKA